MKETVRVKILSDGITGKEVNPLGEEPERTWFGSERDAKYQQYFKEYINLKKQWQQAESKLRTFEIENAELTFIDGWYVKNSRGGFTELCEGDTYTAEILDNGKIKIID